MKPSQKSQLRLQFERGTLTLPFDVFESHQLETVLPFFIKDDRTHCYRTEAFHYREVALHFHRSQLDWIDEVKQFEKRTFNIQENLKPRDYQKAALKSWSESGGQGVICLPTGSGKSLVAKMAIASVQRDALVVVPTLDLQNQWCDLLESHFRQKIGRIGGGQSEVHPITVSTYDSAYVYLEHHGGRFGLLIADECHHLPGETYQYIARYSCAPYRLGLSATPERADGKEAYFEELLGPLVYRKEITEMKGQWLSPYRTIQKILPLEPDELSEYREHRERWRNFIQAKGIDFDSENAFQKIMAACFRSTQGREAWKSWRIQKQITRSSRSKLKEIWKLLGEHRDENVLIFTDDNATAYAIGEQFGLPVLTHHTKGKERSQMLAHFRSGRWPWLVTSKVLNEGVDVPEASVGIIVSGSGSIREHVQRLGRVLRKTENKKALLYELISEKTTELFQSKRRRQHGAYQGST